ncbi:Gfo/Idh/MocA family protein [Spirillospora sp. CA-255316]
MRIGLAGAGRIGARHAAALCELPEVEALVVADADPSRARELAARLRAGPACGPARGAAAGGRPDGAGPVDVRAAESVADLFGEGPPGPRLDGLVVTAATDAHAALVERGLRARIPVFCEKPLAADLDGTFQIVRSARAARVPVQVGFQRRFDAGHIAAREAVSAGRLGWLHTVRSCSFDPAPPPPGYIPASGGLFRDCAIHDLDAIRHVTGRDVAWVMAAGSNRGDEIFRACGDVDTGAALLGLDDGTLAMIGASRYNAAGYDVRLELFGSKESLVAGLDDRTPVTPVPAPGPAAGRPARRHAAGDAAADAEGEAAAEEKAARPPAYSGFLERFADAYDAELRAFADVIAGRRTNPCPPEEALEAFYLAEACEISRREGRVVQPEEVRR